LFDENILPDNYISLNHFVHQALTSLSAFTRYRFSQTG